MMSLINQWLCRLSVEIYVTFDGMDLIQHLYLLYFSYYIFSSEKMIAAIITCISLDISIIKNMILSGWSLMILGITYNIPSNMTAAWK